MTVDEKLKEAAKLKKEIDEIEDFKNALEYQYTISENNRFSKALLSVTITRKFLAIWSTSRKTELSIPDKLGLEIAAKCESWKLELQRRLDKLVVND